MKKQWENATIEELKIAETANGLAPNDNFDADWQQRPDGTWWKPGDGDALS